MKILFSIEITNIKYERTNCYNARHNAFMED